MRAPRARPCAVLLASGARNQMAYMVPFLSRSLFLVVILYVFQALWRTVYAGRDALAGFSLTQMVWYLSVTEGVMLGRSSLWMTVQEEVKDGTLAYGLIRPMSYPAMTVFRFVGEGLVRVLPVLAMGALVALASTGPLPRLAAALPALLVLAAGALVIGALLEMLIGLAAFWMEEVAPLFWIVQKFIFILGGMFFPLDLFPSGFARVLKALPFAFVTYWPGCVAVSGGHGFLRALGGQALWAALLSLCIALAYRRAVKALQAQGG